MGNYTKGNTLVIGILFSILLVSCISSKSVSNQHSSGNIDVDFADTITSYAFIDYHICVDESYLSEVGIHYNPSSVWNTMRDGSVKCFGIKDFYNVHVKQKSFMGNPVFEDIFLDIMKSYNDRHFPFGGVSGKKIRGQKIFDYLMERSRGVTCVDGKLIPRLILSTVGAMIRSIDGMSVKEYSMQDLRDFDWEKYDDRECDNYLPYAVSMHWLEHALDNNLIVLKEYGEK